MTAGAALLVSALLGAAVLAWPGRVTARARLAEMVRPSPGPPRPRPIDPAGGSIGPPDLGEPPLEPDLVLELVACGLRSGMSVVDALAAAAGPAPPAYLAVDEYAACGRMRAQKIQLFEIIIGIEQRAALGGAGLVVKPKRCALIVDVDRSPAQQIDQPRQPGTKRAALQPRAMRKADNRSLRGIRGERAERRGYRIVIGCQTMVLGGSSAWA